MHIVPLELCFINCASKAPVLEHQNRCLQPQQGFAASKLVFGGTTSFQEFRTLYCQNVILMHIMLLEPRFGACGSKAPVSKHQNRCLKAQQGFKTQVSILKMIA